MLEFQFISILNQMIIESEDRKAKLEAEEEAALNPPAAEDSNPVEKTSTTPGQNEADQSKQGAEDEYEPPKLKPVVSNKQSSPT